jgi:hypothetical protein
MSQPIENKRLFIDGKPLAQYLPMALQANRLPWPAHNKNEEITA